MDLKRIIAIIISPFAVASSILLLILSLLEFYRRGFVSMFLDLRAAMIVALVLWVAVVIVDDESHHRKRRLIMISAAVVACLPILWTLTAPFGRLGLATFGIGIAAAVLIIATSTQKLIVNSLAYGLSFLQNNQQRDPVADRL